MIQVDFNILNQKGSPALYQDTFANRPAASLAGRIFLATDTGNLYRDTGTTWVQIATGGPVVTPGIDDVLAVGQKFTAARDIDCDNRDFLIQNAKTFIIENQSGNAFFEQSGSIVRFGDLSNSGNQTKFILDDFNKLIKTTLNNLDSGLYFEYTQKQYFFGDYNNTNNGTSIFIDDSVKYIGTRYNATQSGFRLNWNNNIYEFGAINAGNQTSLNIDDSLSLITTTWLDTTVKNDGLKLDLASKSISVGLFDSGIDPSNIIFTDGVISTRFGLQQIGLYFTPNTFRIGSIGSSNRINLFIDDSVSLVKFTQGVSDLRDGLELDYVNKVYSFGDFNGNNNSCSIVIDDTSETENHITQSLIYDDNGTGNLIQATPSGPATGDHLKIKINGTDYVIELKTP